MITTIKVVDNRSRESKFEKPRGVALTFREADARRHSRKMRERGRKARVSLRKFKTFGCYVNVWAVVWW